MEVGIEPEFRVYNRALKPLELFAPVNLASAWGDEASVERYLAVPNASSMRPARGWLQMEAPCGCSFSWLEDQDAAVCSAASRSSVSQRFIRSPTSHISFW